MAQPILYNKFIGSAEAAGGQVVQFYNKFSQEFQGQLPDERGLTDMFLCNMSVNVKAGLHNPAFRVVRTTQREEGKVGYDYLWDFGISHNQTYTCHALLQAKNFKDGVANFMYKSSSGNLQLNILLEEYEKQKANAAQGVHVVAGYILYGPKYVQFVKIDEVNSDYKQALKDGKSLAEIDRIISKTVFESSSYFLAHIVD